MNFVVVILESLFKTGKSGTLWYRVIPGTWLGNACGPHAASQVHKNDQGTSLRLINTKNAF